MENDLEYLAHEQMKKMRAYIEELQAERDRLFKAHSLAMVKADKLLQVMESIANDYVELSYDKILLQNKDHIKWAKEVIQEIRE